MDAADELFVARGYGPTTIDAIAERAGVSRKTVFTSVGGKAALLKLAFDWTLAGDDEPVAVADRPEVQQLMRDEDPSALLEAWIAMNADIAQRIAPLHHVLVVAADSDPDAAELLATTDQHARRRRPDRDQSPRGHWRTPARPRRRGGGRARRRADRPHALSAPRGAARLDLRGLRGAPPTNRGCVLAPLGT